MQAIIQVINTFFIFLMQILVEFVGKSNQSFSKCKIKRGKKNGVLIPEPPHLPKTIY
jgi:hypothetical protein